MCRKSRLEEKHRDWKMNEGKLKRRKLLKMKMLQMIGMQTRVKAMKRGRVRYLVRVEALVQPRFCIVGCLEVFDSQVKDEMGEKKESEEAKLKSGSESETETETESEEESSDYSVDSEEEREKRLEATKMRMEDKIQVDKQPRRIPQRKCTRPYR